MPYDLAGARAAGYSDDELLDHLAKAYKYDSKAAVEAGYSSSDLLEYLAGMPNPVQGGVTGRAIKRGAHQLAAGAAGGLAAVANVVGADRLQAGLENIATTAEQKAAQHPRDTPGIIASEWADKPLAIYETAMEQIPNLLTFFTPGIAANVAIKGLALQGVLKGLAMGASTVPIGTVEAGANYNEILEEKGVVDKKGALTSLGTGGAAGLLELAGGSARWLGWFEKNAPKTAPLIKRLISSSDDGLIKAAIKRGIMEAGRQVPEEAFQEMGQEGLSVLNAYINDVPLTNIPLRIAESGVAGAVMGGISGGVRGAVTKPGPVPAPPPQSAQPSPSESALPPVVPPPVEPAYQPGSLPMPAAPVTSGGPPAYTDQETNDADIAARIRNTMANTPWAEQAPRQRQWELMDELASRDIELAAEVEVRNQRQRMANAPKALPQETQPNPAFELGGSLPASDYGSKGAATRVLHQLTGQGGAFEGRKDLRVKPAQRGKRTIYRIEPLNPADRSFEMRPASTPPTPPTGAELDELANEYQPPAPLTSTPFAEKLKPLSEKLAKAMGVPGSIAPVGGRELTEEQKQKQAVADGIGQHLTMANGLAARGNVQDAARHKATAEEQARAALMADGPVTEKLVSEEIAKHEEEARLLAGKNREASGRVADPGVVAGQGAGADAGTVAGDSGRAAVPAGEGVPPGGVNTSAEQVHTAKSGRPFKKKRDAEEYRIDNELTETHTVAPITKVIGNKYVAGYIVKPRDSRGTQEGEQQQTVADQNVINGLKAEESMTYARIAAAKKRGDVDEVEKLGKRLGRIEADLKMFSNDEQKQEKANEEKQAADDEGVGREGSAAGRADAQEAAEQEGREEEVAQPDLPGAETAGPSAKASPAEPPTTPATDRAMENAGAVASPGAGQIDVTGWNKKRFIEFIDSEIAKLPPVPKRLTRSKSMADGGVDTQQHGPPILMKNKTGSFEIPRTRRALEHAKRKAYKTAGVAFSKSAAPSTGTTIAQVETELHDFLGKGLDSVKRRGKLEVVRTEAGLPEGGRGITSGDGKVVVGTYLNGKVWLVAGNMEAGKAKYIFIHEGGLHAMLKEDRSFINARDKILADFSRLDSAASRAAAERVPADTPVELVEEEKLAYWLENPENHNHSIFKRVISAVKMALFRLGIPTTKLTESDLVTLFTGGARRWARGGVREATDHAVDTNDMVVAHSMAKEYGISVEEAQRQYDTVVRKYRTTESWMKAPSGKPTKLNERQWVQTRTPAFREWFGDFENDPENASKVIDANGDPLVVYHGSLHFEEAEFKPYKRSIYFFAEDSEYANAYAGWGKQKYVNRRAGRFDKPSVIPAYLAMKNPIDISGMGPSEEEVNIGGLLKTWGVRPSDYFIHLRPDSAPEKIAEYTSIDVPLFAAVAHRAFTDKFKELGHDGVIMNEQGTKSYAVFSSNQIKSSMGNTGQFSPRNPDIRYSVAKPGPVTAEQTRAAEILSSAESMFTAFRQKMQDKAIDLYDFQQDIELSIAGKLPDEANPYEKFWTYQAKTKNRVETFTKERAKPLLEAIAKTGMDQETLGKYLHARHVVEDDVNTKLAAMHPEETRKPDLSGMTDEEARQVYEEAKNQKGFAEIADLVDKMNHDRILLAVESGLLAPEEAKAWAGRWAHYVPLNREEAEEITPGRGQGFQVRGKESRWRLGSPQAVDHPHLVARMIGQYENTIARAQKTEIGQAMLKMFEDYPDETFAKIVPYATKQAPVRVWSVYDGEEVIHTSRTKEQAAKWAEKEVERTGRDLDVGSREEVRSVADPGLKEKDHVITVKREGKEYLIVFNEKDERAVRFAKAYKGLGTEKMNLALQVLAGINRYLSMVNTSLNPEFFLVNFPRDLQTALYNISDADIKGLRRKMLKNVPSAMKGVWDGLRGEGKTEWGKLWKQAEEDGVKTGWVGAHGDIQKRYGQLQKEIELLQGKRNVRKFVRALGTFIDDYNAIAENTMRLAAYKACLDSGLTRQKAGYIAKNLTVNFEKKGDFGTTMNALYLFYNASVQGNARMLSAILRSPQTRKLVAGTIVMAAVLDMVNRSAGGDDDDDTPLYDKIPDYVKERNIILMPQVLGLDLKEPLKMPAPWGFNVFHVVGQAISEMFTKPGATAMSSGGRLLSAIVEAFSPVGGTGSVAQFLAPTVMDPVVQIAENKTFAGNPLKPEQSPYGRPKPEYQMHWQSATGVNQALAKWLNDATGGNEVKPGAANVSPEILDLLLIETAGGGIGRMIGNTFETGRRLVAGEELSNTKTPFLRKFYGADYDREDKTIFYKRLDEVQLVSDQLKFYKHEPSKFAEIRKENQKTIKLILLATDTAKRLKELRKAKREAKKRGVSTERIDRQVKLIMDAYNKKYNSTVLGEK